MKRVKVLVLAAALILCGQGITKAIQSNVAEQQEINKNTVEQVSGDKIVSETLEKVNKLTDRYYANIRACEPAHVHYDMNIFGLKFGLKVEINGWKENKCEYKMAMNLDSIGKDIREVFDVKVTDEQLAKIKPMVECNFTKEQLNLIVDAVIARNQRKMEQFKEMLDNPTEKYVASKKTSKLTPEEEKLMAALMGSNACVIPNQEELMNGISEIMLPRSEQEIKSREETPSSEVIQKPQKPEY